MTKREGEFFLPGLKFDTSFAKPVSVIFPKKGVDAPSLPSSYAELSSEKVIDNSLGVSHDLRRFAFGSFILFAGLCVTMGIIIAVGIVNGPTIPHFAPKWPLYSETGIAGDPVFQITPTGAQRIDMTTLPAAFDPHNLAATTFPDGVIIITVDKPLVPGDVAVSSQGVDIVIVDDTHTFVSVEVTTTQTVPTRLLTSVGFFSLTAIFAAACIVPPLFGFEMILMEHTLRSLLSITFLITQFIFVIVGGNLTGSPSLPGLIMSGMGTIGLSVMFGAILRSSRTYGFFASRTTITSPEGNATPASISMRQLFLTSSVSLILMESLVSAFQVYRAFNWGISGILTEWQPLFSYGLRSETTVAICISTLGMLAVSIGSLLGLMWVDERSKNLNTERMLKGGGSGPNPVAEAYSNSDEYSKRDQIAIGQVGTVIMLASLYAMIILMVVFGSLVYFATLAPENLS